MKFGTLNSLLIICISLIAVIIALYSFALTSENILEEAVFNHLETIAQAKASHIDSYLEKEVDTIEASAKNWFFEEELAKGIGEENLLVIQKELEDLFDVSSDYIELFLLDKEGTVVASTDAKFIGLDESNKKYFTEPKKNMKGYIADVYEAGEEEEEGAYLVSSSVIRHDSIDFAGVLIARIKLDSLEKITTDRTGLGETGEIYLINKDYFMITPSKFLEDTFLKQKIDTENSRECFENKNAHDIKIYTDYRGISVLGTHVYIPEKDWCLLVEINEKEALGIQRDKLMKNALIIILALSLVLVIIGFIIRPLLDKKSK